MTIETKYNIGDEVWVKLRTKGVQKWKIREITIEVLKSRQYRELYRIEREGLYYIAYLCELFPTKEELLKHYKTLDREKYVNGMFSNSNE